MCACAFLAGCGREDSTVPAAPSAPPKKDVSRAHDVKYQEQIKEQVKDIQRTQQGRAKIEQRMAQLRALAKKALPEGATDAQVTAELDNNPKKYPAWRELVTALKNNDLEEKRKREAAQAAVRQRIQREVTERANSAPPASK